MFGKKKTQISQDRLNRAVAQKQVSPRPKGQPRAPREATWAMCRVTWNGGSDAGVLLDISETGARVRFNHRPSLPRVVRLHVSAQSLTVNAEVVRSDGTDVGLRFI